LPQSWQSDFISLYSKRMKKKRNMTGIVIGAVAVAAFLLLAFGGNIASLFGGKNPASESTRDIAMSCTLDMFTQFHIHPNLTIIINGVQQTIPANTGISLTCLHPIHTHDDTGKIHVESPEQRDFTLGDFFAVWGKTFNKNQILDSVVDANHEIVMTVNGKENFDYENLVLRDLDQIVIEYKAK